MNITVTGADWNSVAPLTIVAVTALVVLLADLLAPKNANRYVAIGIALVGLIVAAVDCAAAYGHDYAAFGGAFIVGGFSVVFEEIILMCAFGSIVLSLAEAFGVRYMPASLQNLISFVVLVVVLVALPKGIVGTLRAMRRG